jgi:hypothetical protein
MRLDLPVLRISVAWGAVSGRTCKHVKNCFPLLARDPKPISSTDKRKSARNTYKEAASLAGISEQNAEMAHLMGKIPYFRLNSRGASHAFSRNAEET